MLTLRFVVGHARNCANNAVTISAGASICWVWRHRLVYQQEHFIQAKWNGRGQCRGLTGPQRAVTTRQPMNSTKFGFGQTQLGCRAELKVGPTGHVAVLFLPGKGSGASPASAAACRIGQPGPMLYE